MPRQPGKTRKPENPRKPDTPKTAAELAKHRTPGNTKNLNN